ncbi:MAG: MFS transporter [Isosphaeraceae bacterium]
MQEDDSGSSTSEKAGEPDRAASVSERLADRNEPAPAFRDPYDVLRSRDFLRFLLAGMVATIGNQMMGVAVGWELYERTHSAFALGMVGLAQVFPVLLLAIPSGHAADRYSRQWQIVLAHVTLMAASAGLGVLSLYRGPVWLTYAFLVLSGVGQALNRPARWAILPQLIDRDHLLSAVTWNTSSWQVSAMAGPALGGLVIAVTRGATACYVFNAVCSAVVIVLVASLRPRATKRDSQPVSVQSLLAGLRFVLRTDLILATITLDLLAVFLGGATALLPIYAKDILAIGPTGLGWLRAAPSIGSFSMALVLAHRPPLRQAGKSLLWAVAGFGVATILFGLSRNPYLSFAMLLASGALDNISVVVRQTLVQMLTPDEMRGRVSAVNTIFIASSNELGEFESGLAAAAFGTVAAVVGGGIGTLLVVLGVMYRWPSLTRLGSLRDVSASRA